MTFPHMIDQANRLISLAGQLHTVHSSPSSRNAGFDCPHTEFHICGQCADLTESEIRRLDKYLGVNT